jgi:hypothetical protein
MEVQPAETGAGRDEPAVRGSLRPRTRNTDHGRYLPCRSVHKDGPVGVDVEQGLLAGLAADLADRLPGRRRNVTDSGVAARTGTPSDPVASRAGAGWRAPSALSGARGSPEGAPPAAPEPPVRARTIVAAAAITTAAAALLASRIRYRRRACLAESGRSFRQGSKPRSREYSPADGHHSESAVRRTRRLLLDRGQVSHCDLTLCVLAERSKL